MQETVEKHVTEAMLTNVKYHEQNIWSRVDALSRSSDASYPDLRRQIEELSKVCAAYQDRWEELRAAMQKDRTYRPGCIGVLMPLGPAFEREA